MVVVENDGGLAGMNECNSLPDDYPWNVQCVFEPSPGICFARNRSLREALALQPDFIANLDDDEWPSELWLEELQRIQQAKEADLVGGPVVPVFSKSSCEWEPLRQYYGADMNIADGTACELYAGGNFLARADCFYSLMPNAYDPDFNESGGEDLHLFKRFSQKGRQMYWAANAIAFEDVPETRMTCEWLFGRQRRRGQIAIKVQRKLNPSLASEAARIARTAAVFVRAGLGGMTNVLQKSSQPHAALDMTYGCGRLDAHFHRLDGRHSVSHGGPVH